MNNLYSSLKKPIRMCILILFVGIFSVIQSSAAPQVSNNNGTWFDDYIDTAGVSLTNTTPLSQLSQQVLMTGEC